MYQGACSADVMLASGFAWNTDRMEHVRLFQTGQIQPAIPSVMMDLPKSGTLPFLKGTGYLPTRVFECLLPPHAAHAHAAARQSCTISTPAHAHHVRAARTLAHGKHTLSRASRQSLLTPDKHSSCCTPRQNCALVVTRSAHPLTRTTSELHARWHMISTARHGRLLRFSVPRRVWGRGGGATMRHPQYQTVLCIEGLVMMSGC